MTPRRDIVVGQYVKPEKLLASRRLCRNETPAERAMWICLRGHRLAGFKFRRQQVIEGFVADFYCAEAGLIVELDGEIHSRQLDADAERDAILAGRGLHVVRFANERIELDLLGVLSELEAILHEKTKSITDTENSERGLPLFPSDSFRPKGGRGPGGGVARSHSPRESE